MDPNSVVGLPREYDVWLAPDWSDWDEKKSKGSGWTRVRVRETLYANGRRVTEVLGAGEKPLGPLEETIDTAQEKRFKDAEAAATRQQDQAERRVKRTYTGTDPNTGRPATVTEYEDGGVKYDEIKPPAASGTKEWRTEGRTDGRPGPIMAAYVNGQRTGETREPDGKELKDWNEAQQRSQNPGGKTDDEMRADADRNKPGPATLKPDGKGGTIAVQTMPDGSIKTTPLPGVPSDKPTPDRVTVEGVVYERGADGTYKPAAGIPAPTKGGKLPPGVKPPQFSRGNVATELTRFNQELDAAVSRGEISKEDATGFYTTYHQAAQTFLSEQNNSDNQDATASGQQLTQRSQNMTQAGNRLNWANSTFQNAANADQQMLLGAAGTGRSALVPLLTLQAGLANAAGGLRDQPEVEVRRYPASIQPVAAATNAAAPAAAGKPAPFIKPNQPVSAAQASAVAAQARARDAGGVPTPGEPGGPPLATPTNAPSTPRIAFRNVKTGAVKEMTPMELDAQPDVADWTPVAGNTSPEALPPQAQGPMPSVNPVTGEPTGLGTPPAGVSPSVKPDGTPDFGSPDMVILPGAAPKPPASSAPAGPTPVDMPGDPGTSYNPSNASQTGPIDPYTGLPRQSSMLPRSIQPAMPSVPGAPDIDSIAEQMLADGADPMDVMEIRRRWSRGAAA